VAVWIVAGSFTARAQTPLPGAHAHNDYEHPRPLLDALAQGFCSVEADIFLIDGELRVAHDLPKAVQGRTLETLYLDPLRQRVRTHGGRVYPDGPSFSLLVDIKADGEAVYRRLKTVLSSYREMLTRFRSNRTDIGAVTIILSGDRPWNAVAAESERLVALDGRLPDLKTHPSPHLVPLISDNWRSHFQWNGIGNFPAMERERLVAWVRQAHAQGRRIRFWGAADQPAMWQAQIDAGVDLINTDRLADLAAHLKESSATIEP
jgi:hypothetical protein